MKVTILLLLSTLYFIARAEQEKENLIQEIIRFCKDNGNKYLTFLEEEKNPEYIKRLFYKSGRQTFTILYTESNSL